MKPRIKEELLAVHQLPKLKSLLKKYRQAKMMQSGLLELSELASTVTDMAEFYPALSSIIQSLVHTDSFHIALVDCQEHLQLAYCHNREAKCQPKHLSHFDWLNGLTGLVYLEQKVIHCNVLERMSLLKIAPVDLYDPACIDWLGVPLKRANQTIGVIALQSYDENFYFDDRDCQLLQFIAEHLVTAIDRVRNRELLEKSIAQRTKRLTETNKKLQTEIAERQKAVKMHKALLAMSEMTAWTDNINSFYQALHQEVKTLISAENFYIVLDNKDKNQLEFPYFVDQHSNEDKAKHLAKQLTSLVLEAAKPLLLTGDKMITLSEQGDITPQPYQPTHKHNEMPKAWLAAPLKDQGSVFGVLAIQHYHKDDAYQQGDLALIRFVGQHIAMAILRKRVQLIEQQHKDQLELLVNERTRELQATNLNLRLQIEERRKAEERLYFQAHHDALTKLPNRAMFFERLGYTLGYLQQHKSYRFAVLFIDLDRFKTINDTLGHHAGDMLLTEIAVRLKECVRENDILARLGGDEFVMLLDGLQAKEDVAEIANRIIKDISQPFDIEGHCLHSNVSIGITLCEQQYQSVHEILRDADAAMYRAKSLGRGRYVFFNETMLEKALV